MRECSSRSHASVIPRADRGHVTTIEGPGELTDPVLRSVAHLTGPAAGPLIAAAAAELGATAGDSRISQVGHEPGRSCTVTYTTPLTWPDGTVTDETLVATTGIDGPPDGAAVLEADVGLGAPLEVGLWRYPFDPALPGLVHVVVPELAEQFAGGLIGTDVVPTVVSYRPGRRAVVRLDGSAGSVWVKVLRPARSARLATIHRTLHAAGLAVPGVAHHDDGTGLLVLDHLEGETMRTRFTAAPADTGLARDDRTRPAPAVELADLLVTLGSVDLGDVPARRRPLADVGAHVDSLVVTLPDASARVRRLHERLQVDRRGAPDAIGADVTVHGDLHDGQLVVDAAGTVVGLLDLDDVGRGDRADDLGNLIGHLVTLADTVDASPRRRIVDWLAGIGELSDALGLDPYEVARRGAAATLSLATGPFRSCEPRWQQATVRRIALAEELLLGNVPWPARERPAREKSLRGSSPASHRGAGELNTNHTTSLTTSRSGGTR